MKRVRFKTKDGQIVSGCQNLHNIINELKFKDGDWCADFKKWSNNKTLQQIRVVKGVLIPAYSEYTGYTFQEAQNHLKAEYGIVEYFEHKGQDYVSLKSFADYTKQEMIHFITGALEHLEYDCGFILDFETRQKLMIDETTGELIEK